MKICKYILAMITLFCFSCQSKDEPAEIPNFKNTKWKLVGYVNVQTGELTEAEPADCETCYTFKFDSDTTATGGTVMNVMMVTLRTKPKIGIATEIDDSQNGNVSLFYDAIHTVDSYVIKKEELIFYYNEKKDYLLFKLIQQ